MTEKVLIVPQWAIDEGLKEGCVYKKGDDYYWCGAKLIVRQPLDTSKDSTDNK